MRARNAQIKTATSGRPTIPDWMLQAFTFDGDASFEGLLVPLKWKRDTLLPDRHSLEAWYFHPTISTDSDWHIDPVAVLGRDGFDSLESFIFEASLVLDSRKRRLVCKDLITDLGNRSQGIIWVAAEPRSFSIWSDAAFQIWHDRLTN